MDFAYTNIFFTYKCMVLKFSKKIIEYVYTFIKTYYLNKNILEKPY